MNRRMAIHALKSIRAGDLLKKTNSFAGELFFSQYQLDQNFKIEPRLRWFSIPKLGGTLSRLGTLDSSQRSFTTGAIAISGLSQRYP
jgi:hypothetical protein